MGLVIYDDTSIRRYRYFTISEGIERIHGHFWRYSRWQVDLYLYIRRCVINYLFDLYLALIISLYDTIYQRRGSHTIWQLGDDQGRFILHLHPRSDLYFSTALSTLVLIYLDQSPS